MGRNIYINLRFVRTKQHYYERKHSNSKIRCRQEVGRIC